MSKTIKLIILFLILMVIFVYKPVYAGNIFVNKESNSQINMENENEIIKNSAGISILNSFYLFGLIGALNFSYNRNISKSISLGAETYLYWTPVIFNTDSVTIKQYLGITYWPFMQNGKGFFVKTSAGLGECFDFSFIDHKPQVWFYSINIKFGWQWILSGKGKTKYFLNIGPNFSFGHAYQTLNSFILQRSYIGVTPPKSDREWSYFYWPSLLENLIEVGIFF